MSTKSKLWEVRRITRAAIEAGASRIEIGIEADRLYEQEKPNSNALEICERYLLYTDKEAECLDDVSKVLIDNGFEDNIDTLIKKISLINRIEDMFFDAEKHSIRELMGVAELVAKAAASTENSSPGLYNSISRDWEANLLYLTDYMMNQANKYICKFSGTIMTVKAEEIMLAACKSGVLNDLEALRKGVPIDDITAD